MEQSDFYSPWNNRNHDFMGNRDKSICPNFLNIMSENRRVSLTKAKHVLPCQPCCSHLHDIHRTLEHNATDFSNRKCWRNAGITWFPSWHFVFTCYKRWKTLWCNQIGRLLPKISWGCFQPSVTKGSIAVASSPSQTICWYIRITMK